MLAHVDTFILGRGMYPRYEQYWLAVLANPAAVLPFSGRTVSKNEIADARLADKTPHIVLSVENGKSPMVVRWTLTEKGRDVLPILTLVTAFGSKWRPDVVFKDKTPRTPDELFQPRAMKKIREYF
jgi:hypothetical protein